MLLVPPGPDYGGSVARCRWRTHNRVSVKSSCVVGARALPTRDAARHINVYARHCCLLAWPTRTSSEYFGYGTSSPFRLGGSFTMSEASVKMQIRTGFSEYTAEQVAFRWDCLPLRTSSALCQCLRCDDDVTERTPGVNTLSFALSQVENLSKYQSQLDRKETYKVSETALKLQ